MGHAPFPFPHACASHSFERSRPRLHACHCGAGIMPVHEAARLRTDVVRGSYLGIDVCAGERRARRCDPRGLQPGAHDPRLRGAGSGVSPLLARHPRMAGCRRSPGRPVSRHGLPVPDHRPGAHHALEIGLHHRSGRRARAPVLLHPRLRPPGAHSPRWNAFAGAALAFTGILLLTAPAVPSSGPAAVLA